MSKNIPTPPKPQDPKILKEGDQPIKNNEDKKSLFSFVTNLFKRNKTLEPIQEEVSEIHPATRNAFIVEYRKIIDKTSTLPRKQRDYVVEKVEAMIKKGTIKL